MGGWRDGGNPAKAPDIYGVTRIGPRTAKGGQDTRATPERHPAETEEAPNSTEETSSWQPETTSTAKKKPEAPGATQ